VRWGGLAAITLYATEGASTRKEDHTKDKKNQNNQQEEHNNQIHLLPKRNVKRQDYYPGPQELGTSLELGGGGRESLRD